MPESMELLEDDVRLLERLVAETEAMMLSLWRDRRRDASIKAYDGGTLTLSR